MFWIAPITLSMSNRIAADNSNKWKLKFQRDRVEAITENDWQ